MFDIPVVLFLFRRKDTMPRILERIAEVQPKKLYLLADAGRNEAEQAEALACRALVESLITWDCEVIKHYADQNRGVYKNIGEGAKWVFEREKTAIFIEDDNLPEVSFFRYAQELLEKYETEEKVLWICGTNYHTEMPSDTSYKFTKHLLPCGWASWRDKFLKYYDGELQNLSSLSATCKFFRKYHPKLLSLVQFQSVLNEKFRRKHTGRYISWDYQMLWSVRSNDFYGVIPMCNQITNIGVDNFSIHGGNTKANVMTDRFCEVPSKPLSFPLVHPDKIAIDKKCEREIGRIICPPYKRAIIAIIGSKIKHLLGEDASLSWHDIIQKKRKK